MALYWQHTDPVRLDAICSRDDAAALIPFDHHRAVVGGRWAILVCYHWQPLCEASPPLILTALLNPALNHGASETQIRSVVVKHPQVPPEVQALVDRLTFGPPA